MLRNSAHEVIFHYARADGIIVAFSRDIMHETTGNLYAVTPAQAKFSIAIDSFLRVVGYVCESRPLVWSDSAAGWQDRFKQAAEKMAFPRGPGDLVRIAVEEAVEIIPHANRPRLARSLERLAYRFALVMYLHMNGIMVGKVTNHYGV